MATLEYLTTGESRMVRKLIDSILASGLSVSVYDGEETTLCRSRDKPAILAAMATTESDTLTLWHDDGSRAGWFLLVYGNDSDGSEIIADHSVSDLMESIWESLGIS